MNADERRLTNEISETVLGAAFEVSNVLGIGFLEKVYENALAMELNDRGLEVQRQHPMPVTYKGRSVGTYFADLLVQQRIVIELKCCESFAKEHTAQCLNYLRASNLPIALLLNFQKSRLDYKRIVHNF